MSVALSALPAFPVLPRRRRARVRDIPPTPPKASPRPIYPTQQRDHLPVVSLPNADGVCTVRCSTCRQATLPIYPTDLDTVFRQHYCGNDPWPYIFLAVRPCPA